MSHKMKLFWQLLIVCLACLVFTGQALAVPPLPSSFYGTVKVNGQNVPDGTLVLAQVDGQTFARGYTQTYEGDSVYFLDVPGDDASTAQIEGGREWDTIQFEVGGAPAAQTGTWHSGTNVELNLTVIVSAPIQTPEATPTPPPTQTAIVTNTLAPTRTATQAAGKAVATTQPASTATATRPPATTHAPAPTRTPATALATGTSHPASTAQPASPPIRPTRTAPVFGAAGQPASTPARPAASATAPEPSGAAAAPAARSADLSSVASATGPASSPPPVTAPASPAAGNLNPSLSTPPAAAEATPTANRVESRGGSAASPGLVGVATVAIAALLVWFVARSLKLNR